MNDTLQPSQTFTSQSHYPYGMGSLVEAYKLPQSSFIVCRDPKTHQVVSVHVQSMDAYRYQRELTISRKRIPGASMDDPKSYYWGVSAYCHPWHEKRDSMDDWDQYRVTKGVAQRLMERLVEMVTKYPSLLFNETDDRRARNEGFTHWHNSLCHGARPSVKQLG